MTKQFRLHQVLDHTRLKEDAQAVELAGLDAERRRSESTLHQLREQEAAQLAALVASTRTGALDPATTEASRHYLARLETSIEKRLELCAAVTARMEASRAELLAVAREKRLLERLEERHDEDVGATAARRERVEADELSGQRHQRMQRQRPPREVA